MEKKETKIAFEILNDSIDIVLNTVRQEIKNNMDSKSNVNGFQLLLGLSNIEKRLKINAKQAGIRGLNKS